MTIGGEVNSGLAFSRFSTLFLFEGFISCPSPRRSVVAQIQQVL
jgi:hypothetical protein